MPSAAAPTGLVLRSATHDDRDAVCRLLAEAAMQATGEAHYSPPAVADPAAHDWLYWQNPYGSPINLLWEHRGQIVAHAGLYRHRGLVDGRTVQIGRAAHAVTRREYRGRGLFGSLARRQREHLGNDLDLIIALPTAAALPGLEGIGVTQRDRAQRWFRPIGDDIRALGRIPRPLAATMARVAFGPMPDPLGDSMQGIPEGLDDLAMAAEDDGPLADAAWWQWRFVDNPIHTYSRFALMGDDGRVDAAIATRPTRYLGTQFLQVLHWQARSVEAAAGVLGTAMANAEDCVAVTLLATDASVVSDWSKDCGLRRLPSLIDDTSGQIAIAGAPDSTAAIPARCWSISLAAHHDR